MKVLAISPPVPPVAVSCKHCHTDLEVSVQDAFIDSLPYDPFIVRPSYDIAVVKCPLCKRKMYFDCAPEFKSAVLRRLAKRCFLLRWLGV